MEPGNHASPQMPYQGTGNPWTPCRKCRNKEDHHGVKPLRKEEQPMAGEEEAEAPKVRDSHQGVEISAKASPPREGQAKVPLRGCYARDARLLTTTKLQGPEPLPVLSSTVLSSPFLGYMPRSSRPSIEQWATATERRPPTLTSRPRTFTSAPPPQPTKKRSSFQERRPPTPRICSRTFTSSPPSVHEGPSPCQRPPCPLASLALAYSLTE